MASDGLEDAISHPIQESSHTERPASVSYGSVTVTVTVTETLVVQEEDGIRTTIPLSQVTSLKKVTVREDWPGIAALVLGVLSALALFGSVRAPDPAMGVTAGVLAMMALGFWSGGR